MSLTTKAKEVIEKIPENEVEELCFTVESLYGDTFSKAFRETRCVIPVSGFYEWDSEKRKLLFTAGDNDVFYLGGFYRVHKTGAGFETESIIMTTKPNNSVAPIHDRMPLIIQRDHIKDWITDLDFARNYLIADMPELTHTEVAK